MPKPRNRTRSASSIERAQQLLNESAATSSRINVQHIRKYGFTILLGGIAQVLLLLTLGAFLANSWTWSTLALFLGLAVCLSFFWTRSEAKNRTIIPHGGKRLERFASNWRKAFDIIGIVVLGAGAANAGTPGAWNALENGGIRLAGIAGGVLIAVGAIPGLIFAIALIQK